MSFISTIKNAGRYSELMKVAVKYGFREFVYETKLHLLHSDGKKTLDQRRWLDRLPAVEASVQNCSSFRLT